MIHDLDLLKMLKMFGKSKTVDLGKIKKTPSTNSSLIGIPTELGSITRCPFFIAQPELVRPLQTNITYVI